MEEPTTTLTVPTAWAPLIALAFQTGDRALRAASHRRATNGGSPAVAVPAEIREHVLMVLDPDAAAAVATAIRRAYTVREAAAILHLSTAGITKRIRAGHLRAVTDRGRWLVDADQIDAEASTKRASTP